MSWSAPADGGAPITGYTAYLIPTSGAETVKDVSGTSATFTGVAAGDYTAKVLAKNDVANSARSAASAKVTVVVPKLAQTLSWVGRPSESATVGTTLNLSATSTSNLAATYSVSTSDAACTISSSTVSFVANGICTVIASQAGDSTYSAATALKVDIAVGRVTQTMAWSPALSGAGTVGGSVELSAVPSSGLAVTYSTASAGVCSVATRTVSFTGVGNCVVQASQAGNSTYASVTLTHTFVVSSAGGGFTGFFGGGGAASGVKVDQSLSVVKPEGITFGAVFAITAKASSGLPATFVSKTPTVCVLEGRQFKALDVGDCTVEVTQPGDDKNNAAPATTITFTIGKAQQVISTSLPPTVELKRGVVPFEFTASSGLATKAVVTGACELTANGLRLLRVGACEFQVTQAGDTRYKSVVLEGVLQILAEVTKPGPATPSVAKLTITSTASKSAVAFKSGVPTVVTLRALPKGLTATVTLTTAKKRTTVLPKQIVRKDGTLVLGAITLKAKGTYQVVVKVKSGSRVVQRTVVITVK